MSALATLVGLRLITELVAPDVYGTVALALGIEHRLTKPKTPQTSGMVWRFNGCDAEVLATWCYDSAQDLETTLLHYVWLYNHHLPQTALGHRCPMDAMKQWYAEKPHLFTKIPCNRLGPDTFKRPT